MVSHTVIDNKKLNSKFHLLTFRVKSSSFTFKPGQFIMLEVAKGVPRAYSIASMPNTLPLWNMLVDITPGGPGTTYLKNLKKKDRIKTTEPTGQFVLGKETQTHIFAATGCGIAPFIPMIESLLGNNIHLIWGLRNYEDITLKSTLSSWKRKSKNFSYDIVLTNPPRVWKGKTGRINKHVEDKIKSLKGRGVSVYLSGSSDFVIDAKSIINKNGIPLNSIHSEACY
ncbi:FAD-dependent oxidoreductase [Patescibacteria group bacterium]